MDEYQFSSIAAPQSDLWKDEDRPTALQNALDLLATDGDEERGAVFTKAAVVELILDLVGYRPTRKLWRLRLMEPSLGHGNFFIPAVSRLLKSVDTQFKGNADERRTALSDAVRGVELHGFSIARTREILATLLEDFGYSSREQESLLDVWLIRDDFLLHHFERPFDFVIGNPPYLRQEDIPDVLLEEYRRKFTTIFDRADLFVPFIEKGLRILNRNGRLGYICSDRWTKNRYGGPLRELVSTGFSLLYQIDMNDEDAFESSVSAYPAITVIADGKSLPTRILAKPSRHGWSLKKCGVEIRRKELPAGGPVWELPGLGPGRNPWLLDSPGVFSIVTRTEQAMPALEEAGCKVTIGVATGCDRVFIRKEFDPTVESSRLLPLALAADLSGGKVEWGGSYLANPFGTDGNLVDLEDYPGFKAYLEANKEPLKKRHVAKKSPHRWYRTIDHVHTDLTGTPKLLIPDIKGVPVVALDPGQFYPHHNLYVVTSDTWDLRALQRVLHSPHAWVMVAAYSVRMRGGFLRFQAQNLRRIRIPHWKDVPSATQVALSSPGLPFPDEQGLLSDLFKTSSADLTRMSEYLSPKTP